MKAKLGIVIALIEIVSVAGWLFLLGQQGLPANFGVSLVFCLPIVLGLHVFEEFIFPGGAQDWFISSYPQYAKAYTPSYFFKVNAIPLALSLLLTFGTFDFAGGFGFFGIRAWLVFLCLLAFNGTFHIRGTIGRKRYSPGLITSLLLYLPLAIIGFTYLLRTDVVDIVSAVMCIVIGSLFQPVLDYIKKQNMKVKEHKQVMQ